MHHNRFRPLVFAAAATILVVAVAGLIFLTLDAAPELDTWNKGVVCRTSDSTDWLPVAENRNLTIGDTIYVCPDGYACLKLADRTTLHMGEDSLVEHLAAGPCVTAGNVLLRSSNQGPWIVDTPYASVEVGEGEFFFRVNRPDDGLEGMDLSHSAGGELILWVLRGVATVKRSGKAFQLNAGEVRTMIPGASPGVLAGIEKAALGRAIETMGRNLDRAGWTPESGVPLEQSLARAIHEPGLARVRAVQVAGRLGLQNVIGQAERLLSSSKGQWTSVSFRRALLQAIIRNRSTETAERVLPFLEDEDARVRGLAVRGLGVIGQEGVAVRLSKILEKDRDPAVQHQAANALAHLSRPISPDQHTALARKSEQQATLAMIKALRSRIQLADPAALEKVGSYLNDPGVNVMVRRQAANLLSMVRGPGTEKFFLLAMRDPDAIIRTMSLRQISRNRLPALDQNTEQLIRSIAFNAGAGENERTQAVHALAARGAATRHELERLLLDTGTPACTRIAAVESLADVKDPVNTSDVNFFYAHLDSETAPPIPALAALVKVYGDVASGPDRRWLLDRLDDSRKEIVVAAVQGLYRVHARKGIFTPAEIDLLKLRLDHLSWPEATTLLSGLLVSLLPVEDRIPFICSRLKTASAEEGVALVSRFTAYKSPEAIPVLRRMLKHGNPEIVMAAANTLATFGLAAGAAVPDLLEQYGRFVERDPQVVEHRTFALARAALKTGGIKCILPVFTRIIEQDGRFALDSVADIYDALDAEGASPTLIHFRRHPNAAIRLAIAKKFLGGISASIRNDVRTWWQEESDPWTRFALAFVIVDSFRGPASDALHGLRTSSPPHRWKDLVVRVDMESYEALSSLVANPVRTIPETLKKGVFSFVKRYALPGVLRLGDEFTLHSQFSSPDKYHTLEEFTQQWIDRIRYIRWGLWSSNPAARRAAVINARAVMDRSLVPILINRLKDSSIDIRIAAAETLSLIDNKALEGYRPDDQGEDLERRVAFIRGSFGRLDLDKKIPGPLPIIFSDS